MKSFYNFNFPNVNDNTYIKGENDFSKFSQNKTKNIDVKDLSFDYAFPLKAQKNKKFVNENFSYFKKVIDRTFYSPTQQNLSVNIPLYNISDMNKNNNINNIKSNNLEKYNRSNSSFNIKLKKQNNNIQPQQYINKNFNKVFGNERNQSSDKSFKLVYQIYSMKKKLGNSENNDLMNRPKVQVKDLKIINDYNDISVSVQRKFNQLMNPHKRNLSFINDMNNNSYININYSNLKSKNNIDNYKRQNSNPNLIIHKKKVKHNINLLNDYYNEREIEDFKKSFKNNNYREILSQKFVNVNNGKK